MSTPSPAVAPSTPAVDPRATLTGGAAPAAGAPGRSATGPAAGSTDFMGLLLLLAGIGSTAPASEALPAAPRLDGVAVDGPEKPGTDAEKPTAAPAGGTETVAPVASPFAALEMLLAAEQLAPSAIATAAAVRSDDAGAVEATGRGRAGNDAPRAASQPGATRVPRAARSSVTAGPIEIPGARVDAEIAHPVAPRTTSGAEAATAATPADVAAASPEAASVVTALDAMAATLAPPASRPEPTTAATRDAELGDGVVAGTGREPAAPTATGALHVERRASVSDHPGLDTGAAAHRRRTRTDGRTDPVQATASHLARLASAYAVETESVTAAADATVDHAGSRREGTVEADRGLLAPHAAFVAPRTELTPPVASAAEVAPARPVVEPPVVDQVVQVARLVVSEGRTRMEVSLEPPALGAVRVTADAAAGGIELTIAAEQPETRALLMQAIPEMQAALSSRGVAAVSVAVAGSFDGAEGRQTPARREPGSRSQGPFTGAAAHRDRRRERATPARPVSALDLTI